MSAYKKIECHFRDKNTLINCLKNIGYEPIVSEEKQALKGYRNDIRDEKAEIIVPRKQISSASNDLGFTLNNGEYSMICSDYDLHKGVADKVKQSYALTAIKSALNKNKFNIISEIKSKTITLTATKII